VQAGKPKEEAGYSLVPYEGLQFYVHPQLEERKFKIDLKGFWIFKMLDVQEVAL